MMKKVLLTCLLALLVFPAFGQGVLNVRINEVLVVNHDDFIDGYGQHSSWIELFNTGYEKIDIGGCYLAVRYADRYDENGQKLIHKYYIPTSDPATGMGPEEYRVFYCEGTGTKGTFYTDFRLEGDSETTLILHDDTAQGVEASATLTAYGTDIDMIILYSQNGTDVISVFEFPKGYRPVPNVTLGLIGHYEPESYIFPKISRKQKAEWANEGVQIGGDVYLDYIASNLKYQPQVLDKSTPGATNEKPLEISRAESFRRKDPSGFVMTLTAMCVVFIALVILCWAFKLTGKFMVSRTHRNEAASKGVAKSVAKEESKTKGTGSAENIAAIALALELFREDLHVNEAAVITLNSVSRRYSPWSSKIHGLTRMPERK